MFAGYTGEVLILFCCVFFSVLLFDVTAATDGRHADWESTAKATLDRALRTPINTNVARNVILFLGDGMGVATVTAGRIYAAQQQGRPYGEESSLAFERFPHVGLSKTYNVDHQVPDSAATATAFLGGVKTNMGVIGVNQNVGRGNCIDVTDRTLVESILRRSLNDGKRAGVVTTTRVTHATPAASYAHSAHRDWESDDNVPLIYRNKPLCRDIAAQLVDDNSDINVILGGGRKNFQPSNSSNPDYGKRLDGRNLVQEWIKKHKGQRASYVWNKRMFDDVNPDTTDFLFGLFSSSHMKYRLDRLRDDVDDEPTLADMTEKAIKILRRENNGYFLLVEGGRIDHGHHDGSAKYALEEVISFNEAVERAVSMTDDDDTLIVVTADHSHVMTMGGYPSRGNPILALVDEIGYKEEPAGDGLPYLTLYYANGPGSRERTNLTGVDTQSDEFQQPVNVPLNYETHGGEDVAVYAVGPMSHLFTGVNEQHYLAHAMAYASCVGDATYKADCARRQVPGNVAGSAHLTSSIHVAASRLIFVLIAYIIAS